MDDAEFSEEDLRSARAKRALEILEEMQYKQGS